MGTVNQINKLNLMVSIDIDIENDNWMPVLKWEDAVRKNSR